MTILYDHTGKKIKEITLPKEVFAAPVNEKLLAQALFVYQSNQTQGTKIAQTRGEVNRTTAKVYRQKGTGGARHGSKRAPIYVGGGKAHGPRGVLAARRKLNTKMRRLSLISAFSKKNSEGQVKLVKDLGKAQKTADYAKLLTKLDVQKPLLLTIESNKAASNLKNLQVNRFNLTNIYDLMNSKTLILDETVLAPLTKWLTGKELTTKTKPTAKKATKTIKETKKATK